MAVLGAGPVGLAAAAEWLHRNIPFVVLEAGRRVGANLLEYGHARLFSPWQYNVSSAIAKHLARTGWQAPPAAALLLAGEVAERVLQPFAALPEVAHRLKLSTQVVSVSRKSSAASPTSWAAKRPAMLASWWSAA